MFEVELLRALLIWPGATPAAGELTLVLADRLAPPTPGGYRLRCWAPPANALLEGAAPRLDMLLLWLFGCCGYSRASLAPSLCAHTN
jgi:hypothetical protein